MEHHPYMKMQFLLLLKQLQIKSAEGEAQVSTKKIFSVHLYTSFLTNFWKNILQRKSLLKKSFANVEKHITSTNFLVQRLMLKLQKTCLFVEQNRLWYFFKSIEKNTKVYQGFCGKPKNEIVQKGLISFRYFLQDGQA